MADGAREREREAQLSELTRAFYERKAASFSATRQQPWDGWDRLWDVVGPELATVNEPLVADVACGNLRFGRFLAEKTSEPLRVIGFDGCEPLLAEGLALCRRAGMPEGSVEGVLVDLAEPSGRAPLDSEAAFDLAVCFGFMHHLPSEAQRVRLLRAMVEGARPGALVAASFWQFAHDERLRAKAEEATARAQAAGVAGELATGDFLLGWQGDPQAFRFCHSFTEGEIDCVSAGLASLASEVERFSADGRNGRVNRYVVWRRHA